MAELSDLAKLVHPFPPRMVEKVDGKYGSFVSHPVVEQRLLDVLGVPPTTELVQVVRDAGSDQIVGVVLAMTATIDGHCVRVVEAGDCENPGQWKNDGARLKDAMSDAYKRCAMRLGVGLHLWAQEHFYLADKLAKREAGES